MIKVDLRSIGCYKSFQTVGDAVKIKKAFLLEDINKDNPPCADIIFPEDREITDVFLHTLLYEALSVLGEADFRERFHVFQGYINRERLMDVVDRIRSVEEFKESLTSSEKSEKLSVERNKSFPTSLKGLDMDSKAKEIIRQYVDGKLTGDEILNQHPYDVFIVWKSKILQNYKYLLGTTLEDNYYYELTYNGDIADFYLDVYDKKENICIPLLSLTQK